MNNKKIDLIICVNNQRVFDECKWYIDKLIVPSGYILDTIIISGATGIAEAYNEAMNRSDAKYKVYMHQDTFINNVYFIRDFLDIFEKDSSIGMIGVIGGIGLPKDACCFDAWNVGRTYASNALCTFDLNLLGNFDNTKDYTEVEAVDGMIMITTYDVRWREDLGYGWDFYDVSQSLEFRKNGYKVVVPKQKKPWCIHDCGISKLSKYDDARKIIMQEYKYVFGGTFVDRGYKEMCELSDNIFMMEKRALAENDFDRLVAIDRMLMESKNNRTTAAAYMHLFVLILSDEIAAGEEKYSFFGSKLSFEEMVILYDRCKYEIRRYGIEDNDVKSSDISIEISESAFRRIKKAVTI